ncbi:hypothetical protein ACFX13_040665 [Malus domestica]
MQNEAVAPKGITTQLLTQVVMNPPKVYREKKGINKAKAKIRRAQKGKLCLNGGSILDGGGKEQKEIDG